MNGGTLNSAFLLSGSTLNGTDQVFQGPATWTGGAISGAAAQSTTFANTLLISGANGKTLSGGRSVNAGNTTWSGNTGNDNNAISLGGSSIFNNTGSFTDANAFDSSLSAGTFNNIGTFNKQSNTTTAVGTVFNSTGTVNVNAGTMLMNGGGTSTGVFNIANGTKLEYRNGSHTLNNVTTSGAGTFEISTENVGADATVALNGGTHTTAFVLSGSVLTGTSHTFQGLATWSGGTITGAATASTTFANDLTISGPLGKTLSGGRIVNAGNTTWTGNTGNGNNAIGISGASVFNSNGTFTDANTFNSAINVGNGGGAFNNNGTFNKLSNTTTAVGTQFNSTGTVNVNAGTMLMNGGGTSTGVFNIAAGAKLEFRNGDHTLNNVTTSGAGIFEISTENVGADAFVTVNGGTHTTAFVLSGSAMGGADATFQGPVTWTGGGISGAAATTFSNNVAISGPDLKTIVGGRTVNLNATTTWSGNTAANNNAIRFWNGATINNNGTFNDANAFASFIEHNVGGPHNFNNNGTYNKQSNTITTVDLGVVFNNSGTLNLNAGTMRFVSGTQGPTGTVQVASGATFQHDAASTVGNMITAGNLVLADRTLTVFSDYNNANFGSGDNFNRRANVTTTGTGNRLIAAGDANQGLSGANIINGNTTTPTITIGNVRVGANTFTYDIANTGTTGPSLRGAIQTGVNGGNITDARLSGSGVTAGNWGPVATGNSISRDITITVGTAGVFTPLAGQAVNILNNFENTRSQLLTITSAAGAAAYQVAQPNVPASVDLGNFRLGSAPSQAITIGNTNVAPAGFQEGLDASVSATSGRAVAAGGPITNLAQGGSSGAISVGINNATAIAGANTGTVTIDLASNGSTTSGLATLSLGSASVNVSGTGYNVATGSATPTPINLGNFRVGQAGGVAPQSQNVAITNTVAGPFTESLGIGSANVNNAAFALTNNLGGGLIAAGGSNATALNVTRTGGAAGLNTGTLAIQYTSDGTGTSGLAAINANSQNITVNATGYVAASGLINTVPLNFGTVQVGQSVSQVLSITNNGLGAAGFVEDLNASFGASSGTGAGLISGSGAISGLLAGATNTTGMTVSVNTNAAGSVNGAIAVNFVSAGAVNGVSNGLGTLDVGSANYGVQGLIQANVINTASPAINNSTINLGNVRVNAASPTAFVSVTNQATTAPQAALNATISGNAPVTASGSFNLLGPGATNNASLQVGMSTAAAGAINGTATIAFVSDASNIGNCAPNCQLTLPSQNVGVTGGVYQVAQPNVPASVDLGNFRLGSAPSQAITIGNTNVAPAGFQEGLDASVSATSGRAVAAGGPITNLAQGGSSGAISVGINNATAIAGANTGTVTIDLASNGSTTSGLATLSLGSASVNVSGTGYNVATGSATPTPINLGNFHVGGAAPASQNLAVANQAPAAFSEQLGIQSANATGPFTATNNLGAGRVNSGASAANAITVGLGAGGVAGANSGTVSIQYLSDGSAPGNSGFAATNSNLQNLSVNATGYRLATYDLGTLNFGSVLVGSGPTSRTLSVTNTQISDAFSEGLNARFGALTNTGAGILSDISSAITNLLAGQSNNSGLRVQLNPTTQGGINGSIQVILESNGATTSGLGITPLATENIVITGTITGQAGVLAQGSLTPTAVNAGNVRIGTGVGQVLTVSNVAVGPAEGLNASFGANTGNVTNNGGIITSLPAGVANNTSMSVSLDTSVAGPRSGTATANYVSDGSFNNGVTTPVGSQAVTLQANVFRLANPVVNTPSVTLAARVGDAAPSAGISITNSSPDTFTEGLKASVASTPAGFAGSGAIVNLAAQGTDGSTLRVALNTGTAGTFSGNAALALASTGAGTTNAPDLALPGQNVAVSGKVYTPAVASVSSGALNFGIVHVGEAVAAKAVTVANVAPTSVLNDVLRGSIAAGGPFNATGTLGAGLAAGASDSTSLQVGLSTALAGIYAGTASVSLASHNDDMADLTLGDVGITLAGQVNNYANPVFVKTGGSGDLSRAGNVFTLNFGALTLGTGLTASALAVLNDVFGPADLLEGTFNLSGVDDFVLTGFTSFTGLGAGDLFRGLLASFDPIATGGYTDTVGLRARGSNASGFEEFFDLSLVLRADVVQANTVPEPGSLALVAIAIGSGLAFRRRTRHATARGPVSL